MAGNHDLIRTLAAAGAGQRELAGFIEERKKTGASLNRGKSNQNVETPEVFLAALRKKLGIRDFSIDLAATAANCVTKLHFNEAQDSLKQDWGAVTGLRGPEYWGFLNPPFANLEAWVSKAATEKSRGAQIAMILPASPGTNYWREYVHGHAQVQFLNGRITFVGQTDPYPKDIALLLYSLKVPVYYDIWRWMEQE